MKSIESISLANWVNIIQLCHVWSHFSQEDLTNIFNSIYYEDDQLVGYVETVYIKHFDSIEIEHGKYRHSKMYAKRLSKYELINERI